MARDQIGNPSSGKSAVPNHWFCMYESNTPQICHEQGWSGHQEGPYPNRMPGTEVLSFVSARSGSTPLIFINSQVLGLGGKE